MREGTLRNRDRVRDNHERTMIKTDTVFVERRDSVQVSEFRGANCSGRASPVLTALKWVFGILVALVVLRMCPFFRRE